MPSLFPGTCPVQRSTPLRRGRLLHRLRWAASSVAAILVLALTVGQAQAAIPACENTLQGGAVRWIVPFAPGGGFDQLSRMVAPAYAQALGKEVTMQNISGAGSIMGSRTLQAAKPDGHTVGILFTSGLMVAAYGEDRAAPFPDKDFTLIGRITSDRSIWATSARSPAKTMADLLDLSKQRPILFASAKGSVPTLVAAEVQHILNMDLQYMFGYRGSAAYALAATRGEVDLISFNFASLIQRVEDGDLIPVLQLTDRPISDHPSLKGVPVLAGPDGLLASYARKSGGDAAAAESIANELAGLNSVGRVLAAPKGLPAPLLRCHEAALLTALKDPGFLTPATTAGFVVAGDDSAATRAIVEQGAKTTKRLMAR